MLLYGPDLENLQALPDDLKTKLSIDDDSITSPKEALSRASADRRMKYLSRYYLLSTALSSYCLKIGELYGKREVKERSDEGTSKK